MLKVHIHTLGGEAEIELKKDQDLYRLFIITSKGAHDPGTVWHGESHDESAVQQICCLIINCMDFPHQPSRITILDGMEVNIRYLHEETELNLKLNQFEGGSNEALLLQSLLALCRQTVHDKAFDCYAGSLDNYFS